MKSETVLRLLRAIQTPGLGLTAFHMLVLAELAHRPGIAMLELGRRCRRPGRSIEKTVQALQRARYIDKTNQPKPHAPNAVVLTVSPTGMEVLRGLELAVVEPAPRAVPPVLPQSTRIIRTQDL